MPDPRREKTIIFGNVQIESGGVDIFALKMAKLDADTAKMLKENVLVRDLIQRATDPLAIAMDVKNQALIIELEGSESYEGDLYWSTEALLNILKNSMEHLPVGGRLSIAVNETVLFTQIIIKDNGPGDRKSVV